MMRMMVRVNIAPTQPKSWLNDARHKVSKTIISTIVQLIWYQETKKLVGFNVFWFRKYIFNYLHFIADFVSKWLWDFVEIKLFDVKVFLYWQSIKFSQLELQNFQIMYARMIKLIFDLGFLLFWIFCNLSLLAFSSDLCCRHTQYFCHQLVCSFLKI